MIFNSIEFAIFLPIIFTIYWILANKNLTIRNLLLLASSYFFYGWWDARFLILIFFSSILDYSVGLFIYKAKRQAVKKRLLYFSLIANLGLLFFFKYFNFFASELAHGLQTLGFNSHIRTLQIILPVGISFYTFQTLSYTIDIYKGKLKPTDNPIAFFAFVSFFPQLVAGPIERASELLPQFTQKHSFSYRLAKTGTWLILWGLFKKVAIADNCAPIVNKIFDNPEIYAGTTLWLGAIFFAIQIYADFSGYSDIAIGTARLFGFTLMTNFRYPYFAANIADFWKRWHISLSTWFRDYIYIPLGGSRVKLLFKIRNIFIVFLVSGFWHGANWTFITWGAFHAVLFLPLYLKKHSSTYDNHSNIFFKKAKLLAPLFTFICVTLGWVIFRSDTVSSASTYITHMFTDTFNAPGQFVLFLKPYLVIYIIILILQEYINYKQEIKANQIPEPLFTKFKYARYTYYIILCFIIVLSYPNEAQSFIYFQF